MDAGGRCVSDGQFSVPGVRGERRLEGGMRSAEAAEAAVAAAAFNSASSTQKYY